MGGLPPLKKGMGDASFMKNKKAFLLIGLLLVYTSMVSSEDNINIQDYFPHQKSSSWVYANGKGNETLKIVVKDSTIDKRDGSILSLFIEEIKNFGTTTSFYNVRKDIVLLVVSKNVLGQYTEYEPPFPLVLGKPSLKYQSNDRGDILIYDCSKSSCKFDSKTFPDCILVKETLMADLKFRRIKKSYYAKGVGLVYVTISDADGSNEYVFMKLIRSSLLKETK